MNSRPTLKSDNPLIDSAFSIAIENIWKNTRHWQGELNESATDCILAGADYSSPWTRDTALNSWFAVTALNPSVARNTLRAVLTKDDNGLWIGGQYWDAIIWVTGAWHYYLYTHDKTFLQEAYEAAVNSVRYFEATEFDTNDNLFRGGACFQDGVSGYPEKFTDGPTSGILEWVINKEESELPAGYGLPMKALSTNCLYYHTYLLLAQMEDVLGMSANNHWIEKANSLKRAINREFWNEDKGLYRYLVDADDDECRHEGLGHAFAILFGVADRNQAALIINNQHSTTHGIPCVWPPYERYTNCEGDNYGRHSGTIWPQVNAAWVLALLACGKQDVAWLELSSLAEKAVRDNDFVEIYHPVTGEAYGGMQERYTGGREIIEWPIRRTQTWCATGFVQMILSLVFGVSITKSSLRIYPHLPPEINDIQIDGLFFRNMEISIRIERGGAEEIFFLNDAQQSHIAISGDAHGLQVVKIVLPLS